MTHEALFTVSNSFLCFMQLLTNEMQPWTRSFMHKSPFYWKQLYLRQQSAQHIRKISSIRWTQSGSRNVRTGRLDVVRSYPIDRELLNLINSKKWNFVVLQEQSQIPSVAQARTQTMYPAARKLVQKIKDLELHPFSLSPGHTEVGGPKTA